MKKRACELIPGDIVIMSVWRRVVLNPRPVAGGVALTVASMGTGCMMHPPEVYDPNHEFEVERAELTPAQQHADELLAVARKYLSMLKDCATKHDDPEVVALGTLLAKIDPPKPPTAQELVVALAGAAKYLNLNVDRLDAEDRAAADLAEDSATRLLDRARQAGML